MRNPEKLRAQMIENAAEINRLRQRMLAAERTSPATEQSQQQWRSALEELRSRYSYLCIPGGWDNEFEQRLKSGDRGTVESALCFLEVRPYFFRSGYMWNDLFRKCRRVPMNGEQAARFAEVLKRHAQWKAARDLKSEHGAEVRNELSSLLHRFDRLFPVHFRDSDLDGVITVGDLHVLLCGALKIEPQDSPDARNGRVRKPFSPGRKVRDLWFELLRSESHNPNTWNSADIWATLIATIRDEYKLNDSLKIGRDTTFEELRHE
jgi:hypothetical protein